MSIALKQNLAPADEKSLAAHAHLLFILPAELPVDLPFSSALDAKLNRIGKKYTDLSKSPVMADLPNGAVAAWVVLDAGFSAFKRQTQLRKAIKPLLDEHPKALAIAVFGSEEMRKQSAKDAFYVAGVNAAELPERKGKESQKEPKPQLLEIIELYGWQEADNFADIQALIAGNLLTRTLTMMPPNELNPTQYRAKIAKIAVPHPISKVFKPFTSISKRC